MSGNVKTAYPKGAPFDRAPDGTIGRNSLSEGKRRLQAGWKQSVAGGWPDIPPPGMRASMDDAVQRRRDERFGQWLTVALVEVAIFALIGLIYLSITGG